MSAGNCKGCGAPLLQPVRSGRRRGWCSDKCRKRTTYSGTCIDCGGRTDGTASGKDREPERCIHCQRTINADRNTQILELWEEGAPGWYIAEQVGMTEGSVLAWITTHRVRGHEVTLHRLGGDAKERRDRHRRMIELRSEGKSNTEIAEIVGMASAASVSVAFQTMKRKGWAVPPAPPWSRGTIASDAEIRGALTAGKTVAEIADTFGYANPTPVYKRLQRMRERGALAA